MSELIIPEDDMFELPDSIDIDDPGLKRSASDVLSGDVDALLNEIARGNVNPHSVRRILTESVTLFNKRANSHGPVTGPKNAVPELTGFQNPGYSNMQQDVPFRFLFQNFENVLKPVEFFARKWQETAKKGMVVLPVPPETVEIAGSNSPEDVQSASGIIFSHAGPLEPQTISFDGFFPYATSISELPSFVPTDTVARGFYTPQALCAKFSTAMRAGQPLVFSIVQPNNAQKILNTYTVVITDFTWHYQSGHGLDRFFSMTLREWFPQRMLTIKHKKPTTSKPTTHHPHPHHHAAPKPKHYTIVSGDSLWRIADKFYGDGRKWKTIYAVNKVVLNKSLKAHGQRLNNPDLIYPGVTITIP